MVMGYVTDRGKVRRENQDRFLALGGMEGQEERILCAVADGMGGTGDGSLASEYVTGRLSVWWEREAGFLMRQEDVFSALSASLSQLLSDCNDQINAESRREGISTGTTVSLLCVYDGWIVAKHAGDSRIYMRRQGMWQQLTRDHTWEQFELGRGRRPEDDADYKKKRGKLVNAMGVGSRCRIDTHIVQAAAGDRYLLCTDGFYRYVDPLYDLASLEELFPEPQALLDRLSVQISRTAAADNFTAVLLDAADGRGWDETTVLGG